MQEDKDLKNYPEYIEKLVELDVDPGQTPERIDKYLTRSILNASRAKVQQAMDGGHVLVNGKVAKPSRKVQPLDHIECRFMKPPPLELIPENIPLDVVYEDEYLLVVNKSAGMCVHPGFGNRYGTLVNALLYHFGVRESISIDVDEEDEGDEGKVFANDDVRPGIVHRLDKDTSGLLVVAKDAVTHAKLAEQFADRTSEREYQALIWGKMKENTGQIIGNIGRSSRDRKLYTVVKKGGKHALTNFEILLQFESFSLLKLKLDTGRTHQIRVHLSFENHPVVGDKYYGGDKMIVTSCMPYQKALAERCLKMSERQMLHAKTLGFMHPHKNEFMRFDSELPEDFQTILDLLNK